MTQKPPAYGHDSFVTRGTGQFHLSHGEPASVISPMEYGQAISRRILEGSSNFSPLGVGQLGVEWAQRVQNRVCKSKCAEHLAISSTFLRLFNFPSFSDLPDLQKNTLNFSVCMPPRTAICDRVLLRS